MVAKASVVQTQQIARIDGCANIIIPNFFLLFSEWKYIAVFYWMAPLKGSSVKMKKVTIMAVVKVEK